MKTFGKTPYEVRLELLQLARAILQSKADFEKILPPTSEEIIEEAMKLNSFVSTMKQD